MRLLVYLLSLCLPWYLRRRVLAFCFGYDLHPESRIGLSLVLPRHLVMHAGARIGHFTVCRRLDLVELRESATIGQWNWITGIPKSDPNFYQTYPDRQPWFSLGQHSAVTSRHYIDCADHVSIGSYVTIAGIRSQIFTHSFDLDRAHQAPHPVEVGDFTMIGSGSILLPGSHIPECSIVGAGSVVTKALPESYWLYAGTPARKIRRLDPEMHYFHRKIGHIY